MPMVGSWMHRHTHLLNARSGLARVPLWPFLAETRRVLSYKLITYGTSIVTCPSIGVYSQPVV